MTEVLPIPVELDITQPETAIRQLIELLDQLGAPGERPGTTGDATAFIERQRGVLNDYLATLKAVQEATDRLGPASGSFGASSWTPVIEGAQNAAKAVDGLAKSMSRTKDGLPSANAWNSFNAGTREANAGLLQLQETARRVVAIAPPEFVKTSPNRTVVNQFPEQVRTSGNEAQFQIDRTSTRDIKAELKAAEVAYSNLLSQFGENNQATISAASRYSQAQARNTQLPYAVTSGTAPASPDSPVPSREVVGYYRTIAEARAAVEQTVASQRQVTDANVRLATSTSEAAAKTAATATGFKDRIGNDILVGDQVRVVSVNPGRGATQQLTQEPATVVGGGRNRVQIDYPGTTGIDRVGNEYLQVVKAVDGRMIEASTAIEGMTAGQRAVAQSSEALAAAQGEAAVATKSRLNVPITGQLGHEYRAEGGGSAITSNPSSSETYIRNLQVPEALRGQGTGTALVGRIISDADREGVSLALHTAQDRLIQWYQSLGFVVEGTDQLGTLMRRQAAPLEEAGKAGVKLAAAETEAAANVTTLYHGTTSARIPSIQEQGLVPGSFGAVHATPNYESAAAFARDTAAREGGTPTVLSFPSDNTDAFHAGVPAANLSTVDRKGAEIRLVAAIDEHAAAEKTAAAEVTTLYHGTTAANAERIKQSGLLPLTEGQLFASTSPEQASSFAREAASRPGAEGKPTVVSFPAPEPLAFPQDRVQAFSEAIPADQITIVSRQVLNTLLDEERATRKAAVAQQRLADATDAAAAKVTKLSIGEVSAVADRNVSLPGIRAAEQGYIDALKEGTGQFAGRGISQVGVQEPLKITQTDLAPQGQLEDGHHRLVAAQQLGLEEVPVEIRNAQGELISAVQFRANAERAAAESAARTAAFLSEAAAPVAESQTKLAAANGKAAVAAEEQVTLYHGTTQDVAEATRAKGLRLQSKAGAIQQYATPDQALAEYYAELRAQEQSSLGAVGKAATPTVLSFPAPKDVQYSPEGDVATFRKTIPAKAITELDSASAATDARYQAALNASADAFERGASIEEALAAARKQLTGATETETEKTVTLYRGERNPAAGQAAGGNAGQFFSPHPEEAQQFAGGPNSNSSYNHEPGQLYSVEVPKKDLDKYDPAVTPHPDTGYPFQGGKGIEYILPPELATRAVEDPTAAIRKPLVDRFQTDNNVGREAAEQRLFTSTRRLTDEGERLAATMDAESAAFRKLHEDATALSGTNRPQTTLAEQQSGIPNPKTTRSISEGTARLRQFEESQRLLETPLPAEPPLVLQPTPGAPSVVKPAPAGVQSGLTFAENPDLALQTPAASAEPKNQAEARALRQKKILEGLDEDRAAVARQVAADQQAAETARSAAAARHEDFSARREFGGNVFDEEISSGLERQVAAVKAQAAVEEESLLTQREVAAEIRAARERAKVESRQIADVYESDLRAFDLTGLTEPPQSQQLRTFKSGPQKGRDRLVNAYDFGGDYDFLQGVSQNRIEQYKRAGFLTPRVEGAPVNGPDALATRVAANGLGVPGRELEELLSRWDTVIESRLASRVDVEQGGRRLDRSVTKDAFAEGGLAPNQITPELVAAAVGPHTPDEAARILFEEKGGLPLATDRNGAAAAAEQQRQVEELAQIRANRLAAANATPERSTVRVLEGLQQPELAPTNRGAPGPAEGPLVEATEAERALVKSLGRKVGALDNQTRATLDATEAERALQKAANEAATAKAEQARLILLELNAAGGGGAVGDLDQQLEDLKKRRIDLEKARAEKTPLDEGAPGTEQPKNAKERSRAKARDEDKSGPVGEGTTSENFNAPEAANAAINEAREALAVQTHLASDETKKYAGIVAELRTQYERSSGNIAEVLLALSKEADETKNYAFQKARATNLQAQVNAQVLEALSKQSGYVEALAQAKLLHQQETASVQKILAESGEYATALAEEANARRVTAAEVKKQKLAGAGLESSPAGKEVKALGGNIEAQRAAGLAALQTSEAYNSAQEEVAKAEQDLAAIKAREVVAEERNVADLDQLAQLRAQTAVETRKFNAAQKALVSQQERAAYNALPADSAERGDFVQRFQSRLASRDGSFRNPNEFLNAGQFIQSRFLTTAGFAVSGIATYAAFAGLQKMLTDGKDLQVVLSQIKAQLSAVGDASAFRQYSDSILEISRNSGEAAKDVAALAFQFKGAFGDKLNDTQILTQVKSAVEFARVTGVSLGEIQNSLTAAAVTYGVSVQHVGDVVLTLQDRTGVAAKETIQALSSVAVVAQSVGLSIEKTAAIVTVASKYTAQPGSTTAEGLNRVIGTIGTKAPQVIRLFEQAAPQALPAVTNAFETGQTGKVIDQLGHSYHNLTLQQREYLTEVLGGPRNAKVLIDVLGHYGEVLNDVGAAQNSNGRLAKSYAELQGTLAQQIALVTAALKNIGAALLQLGGADVLKTLAISIGAIVKVIGDGVSVLTHLNDATGGWAARLGLVLLALKAIAAIGPILGGEGVGGLIGRTPVIGGRAAGAFSSIPLIGNLGRPTYGPPEPVRTGATVAEGTGEFKSGGTGTKGPAEPVFIPGESAADTALGRLGQKVSLKGAESNKLISGTTGLLGGALEGLGTAIATFAPVLLIGAIIEGINAFQTGFSDAKQRQRDLNSSLAGYSTGQLLSGANDPNSDIGKQLKAYQDKQHVGLSLSDLHPTQLLKDVGSVFSGSKSVSDLLADQVQKRTTKGFATVITSKFSQDEQKQLIDQFNGSVSPGGGQKLSVEDLQKIAKDGTTDNKQFDSIIKLFTEAAGRKKGLGKAYQALFDDGEKYTKLQGDITGELKDFPKLQIQQSTGQISTSEFVSSAQQDIEKTRLLILEAIKKNAPPEFIDGLKKTLDSEQSAKDQVLSAALQATAAGSAVASLLSGANASDTNLAAIKAGVAALHIPNALTSPDAPVIAQQIVKNQQTQLQTMADHAKTAAEAQAILDAGFKIEPAALQAIQIGELQKLAPGLETALKDSAAQTSQVFERVIENIVKAKGGIRAGIRAYIEGLKRVLQNLIDTGGDKSEIAKLQAEIPVLNGLLTDPSLTTSNRGKAANVAAPTKAEDQAAADNLAKAIAANNPLKAAQEAQAEAARNLNEDLLKASDKKSTPERRAVAANAVKNDQAALITANEQYNGGLDSIAQARANLAASLANGDPVKAAQAQIQSAVAQLAIATRKGDKAGILTAQAALNSAYFALSQAQASIAQAFVAVQAAQADGNPLLAAQAAVAAANVQAANAHGRAEQLNALASQINAQHQLRDAMNAIADAQESVVLALLNAAGDTVGAANETLKHDRAVLARYQSQHPGATAANDPFVSNQTSKIISDQAAARDSLLNRQEQDIQFALDTNKISTGQAIVRLQNLLSTANITEAERQNIERQIYQLKQQITKDLQFDLPSLTGDLALNGLLYQSRRLGETGRAGAGYQDNRQINININGTNLTPNQLVDAVTTAVSAPPRGGTYNKSY